VDFALIPLGVIISPPNQTVDNGTSFTVDLAINTLSAVRGWQTDIDFDATTIKFPEAGAWIIHVQSDYPMNGQPGFAHDLICL
jgi:hypothetical protein